MTIEWDAEAAEKGGYEHFMIKEIHEQPRAVRDTLNSVIRDGHIDLTEAGLSDDVIRSLKRIYIVACGSALPCRRGSAVCDRRSGAYSGPRRAGFRVPLPEPDSGREQSGLSSSASRARQPTAWQPCVCQRARTFLRWRLSMW